MVDGVVTSGHLVELLHEVGHLRLGGWGGLRCGGRLVRSGQRRVRGRLVLGGGYGLRCSLLHSTILHTHSSQQNPNDAVFIYLLYIPPLNLILESQTLRVIAKTELFPIAFKMAVVFLNLCLINILGSSF